MANEWDVVREDPWAVVSEEGGVKELEIPGVTKDELKNFRLKTPQEVLASLSSGVAHGVAGLADIPKQVLTSDAPGFLPQWLQNALNTRIPGTGGVTRAAEALPRVAGTPESLLAQVIPVRDDGAFRAGEFVGPLAAPFASPKLIRGAGNAVKGSVDQALHRGVVKDTAKGIERSGLNPNYIARELGVNDLTKMPDFAQRFPYMAAANAKNSKSALSKASNMYEQAKKMPSMDSRLRLSDGYYERVENMILNTPPDILTPARIKLLMPPNKGASMTVRDMFKTRQTLRAMANDAKKPRVKRLLNDMVDELSSLKVIEGQSDDALRLIQTADPLYAEGSLVKSVTSELNKRAYKGGSKKISNITGAETVKASEALDALREIGHDKLAARLGNDYVRVVDALRRLGQRELDAHSASLVKQLAAGAFDWRALGLAGKVGAIGGGGALVGAPGYHATKALLKTLGVNE